MTSTDATRAPARGPGRPRRSAAERRANRSRLLDAAFAAIREHGAACSIEQMAAAAGVSKPVIHGEFGGKAGIAEAIALALAQQIEDRALEQMTAHGPPTLETAARLVLDSLITTVTEQPAVYAYLVRSLRADDRGLLDNALVTTLNEHTQVVVRTLSPDLDPDVLTVVTHGTFGLVFAAIESWQTTRKPDRQVLLDALTAIVVQAFGAVRELVSPSP